MSLETSDAIRFKKGHRIRSDGRQIIHNLKQFFEERKRKMQPLELGNLVKFTAQAAGVNEKTVQSICLEGVANEGAFGSPKK